jgi:hypothetical protein
MVMPSNRTYVCVVCGELRRLPLPPGLLRGGHDRIGGHVVTALPPGHWRSAASVEGAGLPSWMLHCGEPMFLLGKRAAQAATQLEAEQRPGWVALGARVSEHSGRKKWRPVTTEAKLSEAYPLT